MAKTEPIVEDVTAGASVITDAAKDTPVADPKINDEVGLVEETPVAEEVKLTSVSEFITFVNNLKDVIDTSEIVLKSKVKSHFDDVIAAALVK